MSRVRLHTSAAAGLSAIAVLFSACGSNAASPPETTNIAASTSTTTESPAIAFDAGSAVEACNADAKTIEVALAAYAAQMGRFPSGPTEKAAEATLVPTYLKGWANNPAHYQITLNGTAANGTFTANGDVLVIGSGGVPEGYTATKGEICSTVK